jgi:hypothetical protein
MVDDVLCCCMQVAGAGQAAASVLAPARTVQEAQWSLKPASSMHRRSLRTVPTGLDKYLTTQASASVVKDLALLGISAPASPSPQPTIKQVVGNGTGNGTRRLLSRK